MSLSAYESELLIDWYQEMVKNEGKYVEPILDIRSTSLMKEICKMLRQDIHVFGFAVDTLENYIMQKSALNEEIDDPALATVTTIFISSKYVGAQDLKIRCFSKILRKITGKPYDLKLIKSKEKEILSVLNYNLPINTNVDDLKSFVMKYEKESHFKTSVLDICTGVLEMLYLTRSEWFYALKKMYCTNKEALQVFQKLIKNRLYIPIGIIIFVFKNTTFNNIYHVDDLLEDLATKSQIHIDHLNALLEKISDVVNQMNT